MTADGDDAAGDGVPGRSSPGSPGPGSWGGLAGCAWALAYVPVHVYWAVTGDVSPFGDLPASLSPSQWRQANWAACVVIGGAAVFSLALVRPWGRRLPRFMLLGVAGVGAVFAVLHWAAFSAPTALRLLGVTGGAITTFDRWNLFVFEPWFLGMGLLLAVAAVQGARRDEGRRGAAAVAPPAPPRSVGATAAAALVLAGAFVVLVGVMTFQPRAYAVAGPALIVVGLGWRAAARRARMPNW